MNRLDPYGAFSTYVPGFTEMLIDYYDCEQRGQNQEFDDIWRMIRPTLQPLYEKLKQYYVPRNISRYMFRVIVQIVLEHKNDVSGSLEQRIQQLFQFVKMQSPWMFVVFQAYRVPEKEIEHIVKTIIREILENIGYQPEQDWSRWESLGGNLSSGPAAASWKPNRLDVFVRGPERELLHKWWDGVRWSDWENLSGTLTSSPAAVSWGENRIDVFARGPERQLLHKWWDGVRWSDWEDLGGTLISSPAAASRGEHRLDVFARGANNELLYKYWDGVRWSDFLHIDGRITSEPAAVSWGKHRLDVFARGEHNELLHRWKN